MDSLKLSVLVTTYNHEKYITEAIDSILNQKVNFCYEVIVCDDCSTDGTYKIIHDLEKQHPIVIKVFRNPVNVGVTRNLEQGLKLCRGEYIAILEGDDFWISRDKLTKQAAFLDQHPDCSYCFNGLLYFHEDKQFFQQGFILDKIVYNTSDLISENVIVNFSTCMYRQDVIKKLPAKIFDIFIADWMFNITCSQFGLIGCIPHQMTAYRLHSKSLWSQLKHEHALKEVIRLIPIYDQALDYRFTEDFKLTLGIQENRLMSYSGTSMQVEITKAQKIKQILKRILPPVLIDLLKKFKSLTKP